MESKQRVPTHVAYRIQLSKLLGIDTCFCHEGSSYIVMDTNVCGECQNPSAYCDEITKHIEVYGYGLKESYESNPFL